MLQAIHDCRVEHQGKYACASTIPHQRNLRETQGKFVLIFEVQMDSFIKIIN